MEHFEDQFLLNLKKEIYEDSFSIVGVEVIPVDLGLEDNLLRAIDLIEFDNKVGVCDSDKIKVIEVTTTDKEF